MANDKEYQLDLFSASKPTYRITKPIKLIECFAGIGAQSKALENLGANFESHRISEWAIPSIKAYAAIHCGWKGEPLEGYSLDEMVKMTDGISADYSKPLTEEQRRKKGAKELSVILGAMRAAKDACPDISKVTGESLGIEKEGEGRGHCYVMTYSFPCITADSLILTEDGYKPYSELKVGERVLTKSNTWQRIAKKFDNGTHETYYLQGMGFEDIHCTANHKFWIRHKDGKQEFVEMRDIKKGDLFGMPVIEEEEPFHTDAVDFWYMVGYYLGDGWVSSSSNDVKLACNEEKLAKLKSRLNQVKWGWTCNWEGTCYKLRFHNKEIHDFLKDSFGTGCFEKRIPGEVLRMPREQLQALLDGYLDSDGCRIGDIIQFSSVNRGLVYGMSAIINKVLHRPTRVYKVKADPKKIIQGREVCQHDWYMLRCKLSPSKRDRSFFEDGYVWHPFSKAIKGKDEHVYNMEVENDHSYIIQGCISKNCQDLSQAGTLAGMEKGSGSRSGLLWEIERILLELKDLGERPDVLVMENVPQVHGTRNLKDWQAWVAALDRMGYSSYYKDLNAKDFGIPQNRNRCFMVSILGDWGFEFPRGVELKYPLKGFLQKKADECYYLPDDLAKGFERYDDEGNPI